MSRCCVFVTDATGYVGRAFTARLIERGHSVRALARPASVSLLSPGTNAVVVGPGHRWPLLLTPLCALFERIPATRDSARRLGLVSLAQMVAALLSAIEHRPASVRVVDVPGIRTAAA